MTKSKQKNTAQAENKNTRKIKLKKHKWTATQTKNHGSRTDNKDVHSTRDKQGQNKNAKKILQM